MECCEETLREITRKIYEDGEPNVSVNCGSSSLSVIESNDTYNEVDPWILSEEIIPWTQSKIASYNLSQKLFRCDECKCVGFLTKVAEHWLGTHANLRVFQCSQCSYTSAWARCVKMHLAQQHNIIVEQSFNGVEEFLKENPILEEVTTFLQRLKIKVESDYASAQQVKNDDNVLLSLEIPASQNLTNPNNNSVSKRYNCLYCPYATDRKDLFTRHENIHRDDKPFHCYICLKQFSRADHVKKHFIRIHREVVYDINLIKREVRKGTESVNLHLPAVKPNNLDSKPNYTVFSDCQQTNLGIEKQQKLKIGKRNYKCNYCSWTTTDNWCLKRHLNTHLKPYSCSLCDYKAARSERLTTHIFKVHTKLCDTCSFVGSSESQITFHVERDE